MTQVTDYALVNTVSDLGTVGFNLSGNYALGRDIDATPPPGEFSSAIGSFEHQFSGQFDGMGHTISHLRLSPALFGYIGLSGVVRNLSVEGNVSIAAIGIELGVLAARNDGTIVSAHTCGSVTSTDVSGATGGLVGLNSGTITRSCSNADVSSVVSAGGLMGTNGFGTIRQSFATGNVSTTHMGAGGLAGYNFGIITQSYATSAVHAPPHCDSVDSCAGGLAGKNSGTISQSFATGKVDQPLGPAAGPAGVVDVNIITQFLPRRPSPAMSSGIPRRQARESAYVPRLLVQHRVALEDCPRRKWACRQVLVRHTISARLASGRCPRARRIHC